MIIKATIKTYSDNFYLRESKQSLHGKPGLPFVAVIDDATFEWKDEGRDETLPRYDEKGKRNPEGGEGVRYTIEKNLLVSPGRHRVTFRLPSEEKSITVPVELPLADPTPYVFAFAEVSTRIAERIRSTTKQDATTISGQPDPVSHTAPAATKTERLEAMSFREHSHTELMLTSSRRCCQRRKRQSEFAARPTTLNTPIISKTGTVG
jgi:hypothetical protein